MFKNFDWKNGTLTNLQKTYLDSYAANQIEIYLSGLTDEKIAEKHLSNFYKQLGKTAPKFVWLDSPIALFKVRDQVSAQVWDQVSAQVWDQVRDQVSDQVWDQVRDQVWDQVSAQVRDQVRDQVSAQVWDQVRDQVSAQVRAQVRDTLRSWDWSGTMSFYKFFGEHFEKNALEDWCLYAEQVNGGILTEDTAYLIKKPIRVVRNGEILHYDHDKAVEWADGEGYYFLYGVAFDKETWQRIVNEELTLPQLGEITNADQRAAAIQMLRADRLLEQVGAKLINTGKRGVELYEVPNFMDTQDTEYCMKLEHPSISGKYYIEWVHPDIGKNKDADECMAFSRDITKDQYLISQIA